MRHVFKIKIDVLLIFYKTHVIQKFSFAILNIIAINRIYCIYDDN
ncbi:MAG: hypothetical protein KatS3mg084_0047 [Candidatus Dojkabacteria bacterium]|nr:MAG: hypothetical protein KatS3mg084_0047 [Candidatus Dojkabacteria bacterium]